MYLHNTQNLYPINDNYIKIHKIKKRITIMLYKKTLQLIVALGVVSSLNAFSLGDVAAAIPTQDTTTKTTASTAKSSDLTSMLMEQIGVSKKQANGGTGSILNYAQSALSSSDYSTLASAIPGAASLVKSAPSTSSGLGGLASSLGSNSSLGGMAKLASQFSSLGLSADMVQKFTPIILDYLKGSGAKDAMSILSKLF
jgi:hypothetical protein